jgi:hypothetical protein
MEVEVDLTAEENPKDPLYLTTMIPTFIQQNSLVNRLSLGKVLKVPHFKCIGTFEKRLIVGYFVFHSSKDLFKSRKSRHKRESPVSIYRWEAPIGCVRVTSTPLSPHFDIFSIPLTRL